MQHLSNSKLYYYANHRLLSIESSHQVCDQKIEHYPYGIQSSRIAGAGGFLGNLGLFTCKECGKHLSLITDPMDVCIITRKSKMPIVVSVENYSVLTLSWKFKRKIKYFLLFYLHKPKKITTFAVEFLKIRIAYGIKLTTFANKQQSFKIIKL